MVAVGYFFVFLPYQTIPNLPMPYHTRCAQRVFKIGIFGIFGHWDALGIAPRGYSCPQKWLGLVF